MILDSFVFTTYVLSLDDYQLVFNLYLSWVKEVNLFYFFLLTLKFVDPKKILGW